MLLAMSRWSERNALAGLYYRPLFGAHRVYTLRLDEERDSTNRARMIPSYRIPRLFGEHRRPWITYRPDWIRAILFGVTPLTANFDFTAFRDKWGDRAIPLFADPKRRVTGVLDRGVGAAFAWLDLDQPDAAYG